LEHTAEDGLFDEAVNPQAESGLAGRMAERAEYLETRKAEWFGVPGHDDFLEVELKTIGFKTQSKIAHRHERLRQEQLRELNTVSDMILTATLQFREILPGGETYRELPHHTWVTLAQMKPNCPKDVTPRQALLFIVGDDRILPFAHEYQSWMSTVRVDVDEEVVRDFETTR
jgi:hypothetical protein